MMVISLICFGTSTRDKTLWKIVSLTLMWIVWKEKGILRFFRILAKCLR